MLVADTSALVSLGSVAVLDTLGGEYDIHTTETVVAELEATADYDDSHASAATAVLEQRTTLSIHTVEEPLTSSRIDAGEGSCAVLADTIGAEFLLTDDLRAVPELEQAVEASIAISPIVLRGLVERGVLDRETAVDHVETLAERRSWLGTPIYRRAKALFDVE